MVRLVDGDRGRHTGSQRLFEGFKVGMHKDCTYTTHIK